MQESEREMLIEWLYTLTGISREFWEKKDDHELDRLYQLNLDNQ